MAAPLAGQSLSAGAALAWARALGEFGATTLFAGSLQGTTQTLPLAIYAQFSAANLDVALAMSALLVAVSAGILVTTKTAAARARTERSEARVDTALAVELRHKLGRIALDVRLDAGRETLALIGPSGSGKTSVLLSIAGLLAPDWGRVSLGGRLLMDTERSVSLRPEERRVGMVFQDGALFPNMSVAHNVAYGLYPRSGEPRGAEGPRGRDPGAGSGSARWRPRSRPPSQEESASAWLWPAPWRRRPQVLLLDEPLSALDSVTKAHISAELAQWLADLRLPTILVSHDFGDVVGLADRVAVIEEGHIVQSGTTSEVLRAPESAFVAAFAGINFFSGVARRRGGLTEVKVNDDVLIASTDEAHGAGGSHGAPVGRDPVRREAGELRAELPSRSGRSGRGGRQRRARHCGQRASDRGRGDHRIRRPPRTGPGPIHRCHLEGGRHAAGAQGCGQRGACGLT